MVVLTISRHDVGEFGSAPIRRLENRLPEGEAAELFIDARRSKGVSIGVSGQWAYWLGENQSRFDRIHMLTGSAFIQLAAEFVRRFSKLEGIMRIYTNPETFDRALAAVTLEAGDDGGQKGR